MSGILWLFSILQFGLGGYLLVTGYRDEFEGILGWAFLTGGCILIASGFTSIGMAFVIQKLEGIRKVLSGSVRKPQNVAAAAVAGAGRPPLPPPGGRAPARETPTHAEPPVFPPPPVPPVPPTTQAEPPVFPPPPVPPESFSTVEPSREEQPADSAPPPSFPWLRPQPVVKETEEPLFPADSFH
ncbi:MAG: hypothetical protein LBR29_11855, partial [Methylobacteriaceae bacterium]|nr:hypothetical protein [Methylobacteriaceae bacterium]